MKVIAIFRKKFQPTPAPAVTQVMLTEIYEQGSGIQPTYGPSPFGVASFLPTSKSVDEVKSILVSRLPDHEFEVFEVPSSEAPTNPYSNMSMDELLDLMTECGGLEEMPEQAQARLNELQQDGE